MFDACKANSANVFERNLVIIVICIFSNTACQPASKNGGTASVVGAPAESTNVKLAGFRYLMGLQDESRAAKVPLVFFEGDDLEQQLYIRYFEHLGVHPRHPKFMTRDSGRNIVDIQTKQPGVLYSITQIQICGENATARGTRVVGPLGGYSARLHFHKQDGGWYVVAVSDELYA